MNDDEIRLPANLYAEGFVDSRRKSSERPDDLQIDVCKVWLREFTRISRGFTRESSYALKHFVENWNGRHCLRGDSEHHVENGALIAAAILLGYEWKRAKRTPNAVFKIKILWDKIRDEPYIVDDKLPYPNDKLN